MLVPSTCDGAQPKDMAESEPVGNGSNGTKESMAPSSTGVPSMETNETSAAFDSLIAGIPEEVRPQLSPYSLSPLKPTFTFLVRSTGT